MNATRVFYRFCQVMRVAALLTFWVPIVDRTSILRDLAETCFAVAVFGSLALETGKACHRSFGSGRSQFVQAKIYSMPRRFGVGTMFVISSTFAILATILHWLSLSPTVGLYLLAFVGLVGFAQFALDQAPRQASMIAGVVFFSLPFGIYYAIATAQFRWLPIVDLAYGAGWWIILGAILGYVTGILVGGLFMAIERVQVMLRPDRR